jgi:hypothetical protein
MAKEAAGVKVAQCVQYLERIQRQKTEVVKGEDGAPDELRFLVDEDGAPVLEDAEPELRAAIVTKVHSEKVVNLLVIGSERGFEFKTSIEAGEAVGQFRAI